MRAFNRFYYSFSPALASIGVVDAVLSLVVRLLLYPLMAGLHVASFIFHMLIFTPEIAMVISGVFASALIGIAYLIPLGVALKICKRRARKHARRKL